MATASSSIDLDVPAQQVWDLIGGFDSLPDWLPYIPSSELSDGGRIRHLANPDGSSIVERLMAFDEKERSYTYHILEAPFPQKDYLATLRVRETDGGKSSRVEWFGEFTPVGVTDVEVSALFQGIYDDGLAALKAHYDAK
ncbi:SRPBCC family protein [Novosphingobium kaempferiae]|uniref:SRPBCC family protein n=1 Tax=Novosphingobium kaempferiae TaxID=2896849 RepID=UPI001E3F8851|nr:SRPBCC family protein [Novosphingobium kaempferiae]